MSSLAPPATPSHSSMATEFPPSTPITNFAVLEDQKENIRPLSTGRSAATLSTIFAAERAEAERVVQEGHERHRRQIAEAERREAEGDEMEEGVVDVLDPYVKYLAFITQHHPSSANHLVPFLEHTTRHFLEDSRFSQDIRYLKLWAQYAKMVEKDKAEEIWVFLNSREVGTGWGLFYEEWAAACETRGRVSKADEALRLGIARKAQPIKRLQTHHESFKTRTSDPSYVAPSLLSQIEAAAHRAGQPNPQPTPSANGRAVLGVRSAPSTAQQAQRSTSGPLKGNGARLEIFSDVDGSAAQAEERGEWKDFGTRSANRKENTLEAVGWKGEVLLQKGLAIGVSKSDKMTVFSDETSAQSVRTASSAEEVFGRRQPTSEAELLRADPLRHYNLSAQDKPTPPAALPTVTIPTPSRPKAATTARPTENAVPGAGPSWTMPEGGRDIPGKNGKIERRMFEWDEVFKHGEEWSFEEVRARRMGLIKIAQTEVREWESGWHTPGQTTPKIDRVKKAVSPTVNTKAAMKDVYELFNQTLGTGNVISGGVSDSDSSSSDEDDDSDDGIQPQQQAQPTALPMPRAMLAPGQGDAVPPTPTPGQGYLSGRRMLSSQSETILDSTAPAMPQVPSSGVFSTPAMPTRTLQVFSDENAVPATPAQPVFADENAVPTSAARASKQSIFGATPAKGPLSVKTPLSIFQDAPAAPAEAPAVGPSSNVFSTPVPVSKISRKPVRRNVFGVNPPAEIAEENEDEESPRSDEPILPPAEDNRVPYQPHPDDDPEDEEDDRRAYERRCGAVRLMTPITERTCEFTTTTQGFTMRSSTSSGLHASQSRGQVGDDAVLAEDEGNASLEQLVEVPVRRPSLTTPVTSESTPLTGDFAIPIDDSRDRSTDSPFVLSEGHSIASRDLNNTISTMIVQNAIEVPMESAREAERAPVAAGSFDPPNPCNPLDDKVLGSLVDSVNCQDIPFFTDLRQTDGGNLESLQQTARKRSRRNSSSSLNKSQHGDAGDWKIEVNGTAYEIQDKIGEGGFGAVFKALDVAAYEAEMDASDDEDEDAALDGISKSIMALKVESPPNVWEAIVLDRMRRRLPEPLHASVVRSRGLYCFADESIMLMDYHSQGTLLDAVNKAPAMGIASVATGAPGPFGIDELVAIFFTVELLRVVEGLHRADFIHGDLKIDNCLVRLDEGAKWTNMYDRHGGNGWSAKGLRLIDFGRAIDIRAFPRGWGQKFIAEWKFDERDPQEVQNGRPWSYEVDYHGIASIAYCMLYGKYINTELAPSVEGDGDLKRYRVTGEKLRRYWQTELWTKLFELCLNSRIAAGPDATQPPSDKLAEIRGEFETWLGDNCSKGGKNLKSLLSALKRNASKDK